MKLNRIRLAALLISSFMVAAVASAQTTAASAPMAGASTPQDCEKPGAKHNHTAEKGGPMLASKQPCAPKATTAKKDLSKQHYHPRDAKNQ